MDYRYIDLVVSFEEVMNIPANKRTTAYFGDLGVHYIKSEEAMDRARVLVKKGLELMGLTKREFEENNDYIYRSKIENVMIENLPECNKEREKIMKEEFEVVEIFDKPVLFTTARLKDLYVPDDMFRYDIRGDDKGQGDMVQLKNYIKVNHCGSIISKEPFDITQEIDGRKHTTINGIDMTYDDYNYTGITMTINEYVNSYTQLQNEEGEDMDQDDDMVSMSM